MLLLGQICWASVLVEEGQHERAPNKNVILSDCGKRQSKKLSDALFVGMVVFVVLAMAWNKCA